MNTVLKRKLSSAIASESIAKKIGQGKYKNFCNTTSRYHNKKGKKNKENYMEQFNESVNKRQKKTHYNANMEPIRLSSTGLDSVKLGAGTGADTGCFPKRIREVVWNTYNGETYSSKCYVPWCNNIINVFNYQVGHDIPESKGGTYDIGNLRPICSNCNLSMGNKWTIQEWGKLVNGNDKTNRLDSNENIPKNNECINKIVNQTVKLDDTLLDGNKDAAPRITFYTLLVLVVSYMIM
jgi:hypothetical protein